MTESPGSFELLLSRVDKLEKRVHALEHPDEAIVSGSHVDCRVRKRRNARRRNILANTEHVFAFGPCDARHRWGVRVKGSRRSRHGTEAHRCRGGNCWPHFAWLVWAARGAKASAIAPLVYAGTAVVILVPMLWEETQNFNVFAPYVTAAVLAAFAGLASALVWSRNSSQVLWLVYGATTATAIALSIATHAVLPFVVGVTADSPAKRICQGNGHARPMWPLVALVADASIWGIIFIYGGLTERTCGVSRTERRSLGIPSVWFCNQCSRRDRSRNL